MLRAGIRWIVAAAATIGFTGCSRPRPCPVPSVSVERERDAAARATMLAEGEIIEVIGIGFGPCLGTADGRPTPRVRLVLTQGSTSISVALVQAHGPYGSFSATLGIPDGLVPGPAELRAQASLSSRARPIALVPLTIAG